MKKLTSDNRKRLIKAAAVLFWLAVWAAAAALLGQELLIPGPVPVFTRLAALAATGAFWVKVAFSLLRILGGFAAGAALGILFAALSFRFALFEAVAEPVIRVGKSTPVASFIILIMLWVRSGSVPLAVSLIVVLPVIYFSVLEGLRATDGGLLEMAAVFRFSLPKRLRLIYGPSVRPFLYPALLSGLGLAWKSGIAAEVLALPLRSVGSQIYYAKIYLETVDLFAWTAVIVLLSLLIEKLLALAVGGKGGGVRED